MLAIVVVVTGRLAFDVATVSWARVRFPFDIDWIEGGQLAHAHRILEGKPIFGADDFLPHPYPPLHYVVLAAVGAVTRLDLAMGRTVSVVMWLSTLALGAVVLYREARRGPEDSWAPLAMSAMTVATVGLALRTYPYALGWFDLARSDSMLLLLVVVAAVLASSDRGVVGVVGAGLVLAAAVFTKQTAIFFAVTLIILVALRSRRHAWVMFGAILLPSVVAFAWLDLASKGAFHAWILSTRGHPIDLGRLGEGALRVARSSPQLAAIVPLAWLARGRIGRASEAALALWLAALPACLLPYAKMYGAQNNLVPLLVLSAVLPSFLAIDAWRERRHPAIFSAVAAGAALLVGYGRFDMQRHMPTEEVTRAMAANLAEVKALPGTIACPVHPFLAVMVGKGAAQSSWHSFIDAKAAGRPVDRDRFVADLIGLRADWIILTNMSVEWEGNLERGIGDAYTWDHNFSIGPDTGAPATFFSYPRMAFRRKSGR